ncbi:TolC family protein [Novosphingobium sp. 9]|uniref:TolC family protein n=1 Tax=Novosphingobium sp. 9 TaxID=2025349 RepID=UPI0021B65F82|nr:TolC family protein [Novosphingobium sp. 9]
MPLRTAATDRPRLWTAESLLPVAILFLYPGTAHAETLPEAIAAALEQNPVLAAGKAQVRAADEVRNRTQGAYGPSLSVTVSHDYTLETDRDPPYASTQDGFATSGAVTLTQPLFTFGRLAAATLSAKAQQGLAREQLRAVRQTLILNVVAAYAALRRDLALESVARENRDLLTRQRAIIQARYDLRDATAPDLEQTAAQLALAEGRVLDARSAAEQSAARYRNLVGHYPADLQTIPSPPALPARTELEAQGIDASPDLAIARLQERIAAAALAAARAETGPTLSAHASAERTPFTPYANTSRSEALVAGVTLSMPLYSSGQLSAAVREAEARDQAAILQIEQAWRDMREAIAANQASAAAARERLPLYREAVRNAESAVAGIQEQERAGIRTLREVLDATTDLLTARTTLAQAEADALITQASALRAAGLLDDETALFAPAIDNVTPPDAHLPAPSLSLSPVTDNLAGLPLRPLIAPLDALAVSSHATPPKVHHEDDAPFIWPTLPSSTPP